MVKQQLWKIVIIIAAIVISAWYVYPPKEKLKQGLDLAGGTSLVYEIDVSGLSPQERKGLAQNMIPILLRRIDPTHVANIVMRPQGDTRIEIQLPLASREAQRLREEYQNALNALDAENINLMALRQLLTLPPEARQAKLEAMAGADAARQGALKVLAEIFDLRRDAQQQRDQLNQEMELQRQQLKDLGLDFDTYQYSVAQWAKLEPQKRAEEISAFVKNRLAENTQSDSGQLNEKQQKAIAALGEYVNLYQKWMPVVEELTRPHDGLNDRWKNALKAVSDLNISIEQMQDILEMPAGSTTRRQMLEQLKTKFPSRAEKIDAVVRAYDAYAKVGGRLDDPEDLKRMLKGAGVLEFRILPTLDSGNRQELMAYVDALTTKGPKQASDSRYMWFEIEDPQHWPENLGITGTFGQKKYVLASNQDNEVMLQKGPRRWKLKRAYPTTDDQGRRAIGFTFDEVAANLFYNLTSTHIGKPLCILLDDRAISAPSINSAIRSQGIITGRFTQTEVEDMVNKLNAGSFPARLSDVPISEKTIGATLGADNLQRSIRAGIIGLAAVASFMLIYYMLAGAIADVALLLNILLVLGVMAMLQSTFTLPGIAGLILTMGMSVDANVLIFERIREEQKRGSTIRSAIANGYARAFNTIFDANVTTFGVAAVLYVVASEEIKGFAIVLMLGILASMFTALFVTRVIFDLLTGSRLLTKPLTMFAILQNSQVDWMKLRPLFFILSTILVIGGLTIFFVRDSSKYDIEFTGGTSVLVELKEGFGGSRADVQKRFSQYAQSIGNKELAAARVNEVGTTGRQFEIVTTATNLTKAELRFEPTAAPTPQQILEKIEHSADKLGQRLGNLQVSAKGDGLFEVSTSRFSTTAVAEVLNDAFAGQAQISQPVVEEVVGDAVRAAFGEFLAIRENLGLTIESESRILPESDQAMLLADFLGGVKFVCSLAHPTSAADLDARLRDIRFKPDMQDLAWYRWNILTEALLEPEPQQLLQRFVYVAVHPEAGFRELDENEWARFVANEKTKLTTAVSLESSLARVTQIDPSIGAKAKNQAMVAIILSLIGIVAYIWVRFGTARYGVAAIVALIHDVCITVGLVCACTYVADSAFGKALLIGDFKINLEIIAAFLTLIGYSLNDTIVVFDRIRENRRKSQDLTAKLINDSINQTLSRTILTSGTTLLAVIVMYIWGGEGLRGFTFALLVGIVVGTYSSVAIASPILLIDSKKMATPAKTPKIEI